MLRTLLVGLFLLAPAARAQLVPEKAGWQLEGAGEKKKRGVFTDMESWTLKPGPGLKGRPRVLVALTNRGSKPAGAAVLRYAFSARLVRRDQPAEEGAWSVPFIAEERRVPQAIAPGASRDVPVFVNRVALDDYLRRLYRTGFWLDALRVQVMVEPRSGETLKDRVLESTLPVAWQAP